MKILFLSDDFPPQSFGGAGIVAYNLARRLSQKGNEVFVITTTKNKSEKGKSNFEGLNIFKLYTNYRERWKFWLSIYNPQTVKNVEKIIKRIRPDIIHAHNIHTFISYYCLKIAKKYSRAVFLTAHDVMMVNYGKLMPKNKNCFYKISVSDKIKEAGKRYNPFRNLLIRHYLKYVDKIFAVSDALKNVLKINRVGNVETIYNGIDIEAWSVDPFKIEQFKNKYDFKDKKIVLFGGRLSMAKGGRVILEAMALVMKKINNTILFIAGEKNSYSEEMEKLTKDLCIDDNIKFTDGWLDRETMKCAFFSSDVCVVPSVCFDSFPTTNLEAMASGKPVVGTCFGGTPEIVIDNQTGHIVDPSNVQELSKKIIDLLKNPQKAKQFGEAGYERVKKYFSLQEQADKIIENYNKYI
jgi:glycosyltransferase involved in cell wall biosynthesis